MSALWPILAGLALLCFIFAGRLLIAIEADREFQNRIRRSQHLRAQMEERK